MARIVLQPAGEAYAQRQGETHILALRLGSASCTTEKPDSLPALSDTRSTLRTLSAYNKTPFLHVPSYGDRGMVQVSFGGWMLNSISPVLWFLFRFCLVIWTKFELG